MLRSRRDTLQFAYQPKLEMDDLTIYLLNRVYAHQNSLASMVRVMFFDFSNSFNTTRPSAISIFTGDLGPSTSTTQC